MKRVPPDKQGLSQSKQLTNDKEFDAVIKEKQPGGCPYVSTFKNNEEYSMLIDSRADICAISEKYRKKISAKDEKTPTSPLTGLNIKCYIMRREEKQQR